MTDERFDTHEPLTGYKKAFVEPRWYENEGIGIASTRFGKIGRKPRATKNGTGTLNWLA